MPSAEQITSRPFDGLDDVLAVREFLAANYGNPATSRTWEIRRWEGRFWHDDPEVMRQELASRRDDIRLWECEGEIVAVAHPEGTGDVHLQTQPSTVFLEAEMLAWAEGTLAVERNGARALLAFCFEDDEDRRRLLRGRGYQQEDWWLVQRWCSLEGTVPGADVADGYHLRSLRPGDRDDAQGLADVINAAFGHSFGPEALLNFEHSPSYRDELQIVAVDDEGTIAAHAGVTLDERNSLAIVEPVCTHPDHRRHGLASACMAEGVRRAQQLGATMATVDTGHDNPSNAVYEGLGFTSVRIVEPWRRTWPSDSIPEALWPSNRRFPPVNTHLPPEQGRSGRRLHHDLTS